MTTGLACSITEEYGVTDVRNYGKGVFALPSPLRDHTDTIRRIFRAHSVVAALLMAEYWTFPADDPDAAIRYAGGDGTPPSQHPNRQEGVVVAMTWPLGAYTRVATQRIVRAGNSAYLRPWPQNMSVDYEESPQTLPKELSWTSMWLEEVLPGRDPFAESGK